MMSGLARLVAAAAEAFPTRRARELVLALASLDRAQGSAGLGEACLVAQQHFPEAEAEVFVLPHDGAETWWSFRAPRGWTPWSAWLAVPGEAPLASYALMPCILATGSANLQRAVRPIVLAGACNGRGPVAGAMLVARDRCEVAAAVTSARESGIAAIVTDAYAIVEATTKEQGAGRIELPPDSTIAVFSLTPGQLDRLLGSGSGLVEAEAIIELGSEPSAGGLATRFDEMSNVLLTAHLCHRAPGANDNASGVAAVLGAMTVLRALLNRPVGVLCGGEIVAAAWWAHETALRGQLPTYVLNADAVAGGPTRCGSSLELEAGLGPGLPLAAIVVAAAHRLVSTSPCDLVSRPFIGASDHGVFASAKWRPIVASLTCTQDRFNHTSLDGTETLDWARLHHAGALLAATAAFLDGLHGRHAVEMLLLIEQWLSPRLLTAAPDFPLGCQIEGWAKHLDILTRTMRKGVAGSSRVDFSASVARLQRDLDGAAVTARKHSRARPTPLADQWHRHIEGPFNLFGVIDRLDPSSATALLAQVRADKSRLGLLIALHATLDGEVRRDAIAQICQSQLDRAVREDQIDEALGWFERAGWASRIPLGQ
jgi:hypothetical protein